MRSRVVLGWLTCGLVGLGVLGFELMPVGGRGLWAFVMLLLVLGVFLPLWLAVALGFLSFAVFSVYVALVAELRPLSGAQLMALFFIPIAPLWLSAFRRALNRIEHLVRFARGFGARHSAMTDPEHDEFTPLLLPRLFQAISSGWEARGAKGFLAVVHIQNDQLARELLGDEAWRLRNRRVLSAIRALRPAAWIFVDDVRRGRTILVDELSDGDGGAEQVGQALAQAVEVVDGVKVRVGVAGWSEQGDTPESLLLVADK